MLRCWLSSAHGHASCNSHLQAGIPCRYVSMGCWPGARPQLLARLLRLAMGVQDLVEGSVVALVVQRDDL